MTNIFVTERQRSAYFSKLILNDYLRCGSATPPTIVFHQFQGVCENFFANVPQDFEWTQILGALSGHNIWGCHTVMEDLFKAARPFFKPSVLNRIRQQSNMEINTVIDCSRVDQYAKPHLKPKDIIKINYGSRLNNTYYPREIFHETDAMYRAGRNLKIVLTSPQSRPGRIGTTTK